MFPAPEHGTTERAWRSAPLDAPVKFSKPDLAACGAELTLTPQMQTWFVAGILPVPEALFASECEWCTEKARRAGHPAEEDVDKAA